MSLRKYFNSKERHLVAKNNFSFPFEGESLRFEGSELLALATETDSFAMLEKKLPFILNRKLFNKIFIVEFVSF